MRKLAIALLFALFATLATAQTQHQVILTWQFTQGSDPATGFYVFRQAAGSTGYTQLNATEIPVETLTYADATVVNGTSYTYYVTAVDASNNQSGPSNTYSVSIPANPSAPTNLTGSVK